jgi:hypothetical protein
LTGAPTPAFSPELCWPAADRAPDEDVDVMASFVSRRWSDPSGLRTARDGW